MTADKSMAGRQWRRRKPIRIRFNALGRRDVDLRIVIFERTECL